MSTRSHLLELSHGRRVAVEEYGAANGEPVLFFHGWPSSRTMAQLTDDAARELNVRIISPDRPGIRDSTFHETRTLLDWPDVVRQIGDALQFDRFRILAVSGGAPYAFVTSWKMPERVKAIAVVNGVPPIAELADRSGLMPLHRRMLRMRERRPRLLRFLFHVARPFAATRIPMLMRPWLVRALHGSDAEVLREARAFEACFESARQAWRVSAAGIIHDAEIYVTPWGFPLEEVRAPVRLWHGQRDRTFHYSLAEQLAARLPNCTLRLVESTGHFSLPIRHMGEIVGDLIATPAG